MPSEKLWDKFLSCTDKYRNERLKVRSESDRRAMRRCNERAKSAQLFTDSAS